MSESLTLVERCFHVWGADGHIQYQGIVRGDLGDGYYLVQYDGLTGEHPTMAIHHISEMVIKAAHGQAPGAWQFYEDRTDMNYYNTHFRRND